MKYEIVYNKALKVFSQLYVGVKSKNHKNAQLAFATPYETTAAGLKRQETVKNWTREYNHDSKKDVLDLRIVENKPRAGFKITDDVKRTYWGGGNVVWRLYDPLGWEIEIQSNNLMALLQSVGVGPNGEVPGECVIARDGAHNVLLPVSTAEYKNSIKGAENAKAPGKVPMKDRVIGRMYRLASGEFGRYMGKMYVREETNDHGHYDSASCGYIEANVPGQPTLYASATRQINTVLNDAKMDQYEIVYIPEEVKDAGYGEYKTGGESKLYKSAPLIAELDKAEITKDEAEKIVNSNKLEFVSTRDTAPVYASFDSNLQVLKVPELASADVIKKMKDSALHTARQLFEMWAGRAKDMYRRKEISVGDMLCGYPTRLLYCNDAGEYFCRSHTIDPNTQRNQAYHYNFKETDDRTFALSGPVQFHGNSVISYERIRNMERVTTITPQTVFKGHVHKNIDSIEEFEALIDECIAQKRFWSLKFKKVS